MCVNVCELVGVCVLVCACVCLCVLVCVCVTPARHWESVCPYPLPSCPPLSPTHPPPPLYDSGNAGDPGYKATARMCIESALCLALQRDVCSKEGGEYMYLHTLSHIHTRTYIFHAPTHCKICACVCVCVSSSVCLRVCLCLCFGLVFGLCLCLCFSLSYFGWDFKNSENNKQFVFASGVLTSATGLGNVLIDRLNTSGMEITVEKVCVTSCVGGNVGGWWGEEGGRSEGLWKLTILPPPSLLPPPLEETQQEIAQTWGVENSFRPGRA